MSLLLLLTILLFVCSDAAKAAAIRKLDEEQSRNNAEGLPSLHQRVRLDGLFANFQVRAAVTLLPSPCVA